MPVKDFLKNGDFASARLLLRQAAEAGSADATLMFGETFDPLVIKSVLSHLLPQNTNRFLAMVRAAQASVARVPAAQGSLAADVVDDQHSLASVH